MRLTRFSDISLRALMYLGAHRLRAVSTSEMALGLSVSKDHLMKSLQALTDLGLVSSTRGRRGGFRLVATGTDIRLGALVRELEPDMALVECFAPASTCPLTGHCGLADVLSEARDRFFETLDRHTLADLLEAERPQLVQLGGMGARADQ
jgi:Rrf2 family transcriptional regulator, nitric oxide-sensitive transcriptional repressor